MRYVSIIFCCALALTAAFNTASAQSTARENRTNKSKPAESKSATAVDASQDDDDVINVDTKLVVVPVVVSKRDGSYLPDLAQSEFTVQEDGVEQRIEFFATVKEPFHVLLMLDTSASTEEKLGQIQRAAAAFVEQLQPADRVRLVSFDDRVYDSGEFTADRASIKAKIAGVRPGQGTKLYDAVALALRALQPIEGRKAVVLFTDGVDYHSDRETYDGTRRALEESGIIVYPIRYDTREATEALARGQASGGQTVDLGTILGGGSPTSGTPTTFPGGSIPPTSTGNRGPLNLPGSIIIPGRRTRDRYPDDSRDDRGYPGSGRRDDNNPFPDSSRPYPDARRDDPINRELDRIYKIADDYLEDLARESGGRLLRADTLGSLPAAFAQIAAELRTQYSLGYYPTNAVRDGKYRKIKVRTTRKNVAVRARPGYRAPRS